MLNQIVYVFAITLLNQKVSGFDTDLCDYDNLGIIGGHTIPIQDAPFMAALLFHQKSNDLFHCGASIIHERFLLTAAHCFLPSGFASIGSTRYRNTSTNIKIDVEKFICYEDYNNETDNNDICLVKLKKPVPFSDRIGKITLPDKNFVLKIGSMLNVTGWGATVSPFMVSKFDKFENSDPTTDPLDVLQTSVPVTSQQCCHDEDDTIDDTNICAGMMDHGACFGDSGGPVTYQGVLAGVVSRGIIHKGRRMCGTGFDVYTNVASYLDWIDNTISKNLH